MFDAAEVGVLLELTANISFALQYLEKDEAVQFLSHFDSLTGLAKRPLFCQRLAQTLAKDAPETSRTVLVFDVQKLGAINDSFGRYVGDSLIEKIAARLKQTYTDSDSVGYFGGGTFVISIADSRDASDTGHVLQGVASPLFSEPFHIDGQELRPTIRSGVAFYPHDAKTADALVQNAEAALKAAREDNEKYMMYGLVTQRPTSRSLALETRLTRALETQRVSASIPAQSRHQERQDPRSRSAAALEGLGRRHYSALGFHSAARAVRSHRRRRRMGFPAGGRGCPQMESSGPAQHTRGGECFPAAIAAPGLRGTDIGRHCSRQARTRRAWTSRSPKAC